MCSSCGDDSGFSGAGYLNRRCWLTTGFVLSLLVENMTTGNTRIATHFKEKLTRVRAPVIHVSQHVSQAVPAEEQQACCIIPQAAENK